MFRNSMMVIHLTLLNNFALKLYFIQLSTTRQWLAVEAYFNMRLLAVFFKHQKSKFPQIEYITNMDSGIYSLSQSCIYYIAYPRISVTFIIFSKISQFSPCFFPIYVFGLNLRFLLPYFGHYAFMHHALHSLDASVQRNIFIYRGLGLC